jgi:type I site-specific restriction endonuclease
LDLPRMIRQEDGTRDRCVLVFNEMDYNSSGRIDISKFTRYLDKLHVDRDREEVVSQNSDENEFVMSDDDTESVSNQPSPGKDDPMDRHAQEQDAADLDEFIQRIVRNRLQKVSLDEYVRALNTLPDTWKVFRTKV